MVFLLPGRHSILLLDSDCSPVALSSAHEWANWTKCIQVAEDRPWQYLVQWQSTRCRASYSAPPNAGFVVIFASSHPPVLDVEWQAELATVSEAKKQNILKAKSVELVDQHWSKCKSAISKPQCTSTPEKAFPCPNLAEPRCSPIALES